MTVDQIQIDSAALKVLKRSDQFQGGKVLWAYCVDAAYELCHDKHGYLNSWLAESIEGRANFFRKNGIRFDIDR